MLEISDIHLTLDQGRTEDACRAAAQRAAARILNVGPQDIRTCTLHRRSIDARNKRNVHLIVTVRMALASTAAEEEALARATGPAARNVRHVDETRFAIPRLAHRIGNTRPIVVGAGCAGLFAALALAEAGAEPLLLERGRDAARRSRDIERFHATGMLDPESNILFGLGGAGTFSDGKLTTGTKNPAHRHILETLVAAGAPREILYDAKPHVGSDILPRVAENLVARIRALGGEVRFGCRMIDIERAAASSGAVRAIVVETTDERGLSCAERIPCAQLILACGHSARDVFSLLEQRGFALARKTFAMGVRIEHLQRTIDRAQYGRFAGHPALGAAPYKLVAHLPSGRSVFTFCMCPGGEVVAAASEPGGVVTNGASLHARAGANANAALLVNVTPDDLPGTGPLAGIELQRTCERRAFELGGGTYRAPAQLVGDFLAHRSSVGAGSVAPTYPLGVTWTRIDEALPAYISESLRQGIPALGRKLKGFDASDAVLTAVESRSSSPVTVTRDRDCHAADAPGLYPCGEGAGYAGGIMSAAADGIRCAQAVLEDLA